MAWTGSGLEMIMYEISTSGYTYVCQYDNATPTKYTLLRIARNCLVVI